MAIGDFSEKDFVLHFYFYPFLKQPDGKMVLITPTPAPIDLKLMIIWIPRLRRITTPQPIAMQVDDYLNTPPKANIYYPNPLRCELMWKFVLRLVCDIENLLIVSQVFTLAACSGLMPLHGRRDLLMWPLADNRLRLSYPLWITGQRLRLTSLPNFVD